MIKANEYRTVSCGELREENIGQQVKVAGWVENIRDHGGVMFLDIRDQYGVLQVVVSLGQEHVDLLVSFSKI